jgi:hypothetical protein
MDGRVALAKPSHVDWSAMSLESISRRSFTETENRRNLVQRGGWWRLEAWTRAFISDPPRDLTWSTCATASFRPQMTRQGLRGLETLLPGSNDRFGPCQRELSVG